MLPVEVTAEFPVYPAHAVCNYHAQTTSKVSCGVDGTLDLVYHSIRIIQRGFVKGVLHDLLGTRYDEVLQCDPDRIPRLDVVNVDQIAHLSSNYLIFIRLKSSA